MESIELVSYIIKKADEDVYKRQFFVSADLFSFPWWRYRISKASKGVDLLFQANYVPSKTVDMYVNYRYKQKERDVTGTQGKVILPTYHHLLRYRLNYLPCSSSVSYTHLDVYKRQVLVYAIYHYF